MGEYDVLSFRRGELVGSELVGLPSDAEAVAYAYALIEAQVVPWGAHTPDVVEVHRAPASGCAQRYDRKTYVAAWVPARRNCAIYFGLFHPAEAGRVPTDEEVGRFRFRPRQSGCLGEE